MNQEKVGKLIARKRKENGFTQEQLAEKLKVSTKEVSKWETGKSMPDLAILQELCKTLGVSLTTLVNGEETREEELVLKLLWVIEKLKQLYFVIIGLVICNIPYALESISFVEETMQGKDFLSGMLNGCFAGIKIVGVVVFAYGVACYINRAKQEKGSVKF